MSIEQDDVLSALAEVRDPNTQSRFVEARAIKRVSTKSDSVAFDLEFAYPASASDHDTVRAAAETAVRKLPGVKKVTVNIVNKIAAHAVQRGLKPLPGVKNIIAIASGKGGVGKSTTAVNLALALSRMGAMVGLLDADIYGPSQPQMLGLVGEQPRVNEAGEMQPLRAHGVQVMSIGFLVETDTPMIWRGPMVMQALDQLLNKTAWEGVDYLVVDLPPGTGDTQLSLAQKVPVTGAIIVTTPQDIALLDARKGLKMFEKVDIPILGVVENMSLHVCSQCGHETHIFGSGGGEQLCVDHGVEFLGGLPLELSIRELADGGNPSVVGAPDSYAAERYRAIALRTAIKVGERARDMSGKFPNIVVQHT